MSQPEPEGPRSELDALLASPTPNPSSGSTSASSRTSGSPSVSGRGVAAAGGDEEAAGRERGAGPDGGDDRDDREGGGHGPLSGRLEAWLRGDDEPAAPVGGDGIDEVVLSGGPGATTAPDGVGELREVAVDAIGPNEYQPRESFDEEGLAALADSIRELGVLQPVLVRPRDDGRYELVAGERRWRAARRAGLRMIPALVRGSAELESLERAIVENLHREDLNPLEEATAYQQLVDDFGLTQDDVARRVGKSRSAVANTLRLLQLPAVVQRLVREGRLSAGHARALLAVSDRGEQRALAQRVVDEDLSVRQAEEAVRRSIAGSAGRSGRADGAEPESGGRRRDRSAAELEVERLLEERLDTQVEVRSRGLGGQLLVRFADSEDLERIVRMLLSESRGDDES